MKMLLDMWKQSGIKPAALTRRPKLKTQDRYYLESFWELSRSRGAGESFGHIPISEYEAYWRAFRIDPVWEREKFFRLVSKLDESFVAYTHEQRRKQLEAAQSKPPSARGGVTLK